MDCVNALSYVTSATTSPAVNSLAWIRPAGSPNTGFLAVATNSTIELYQFNTGTLALTWVQSIAIDSGANAVAWSRDGSYLAVGTGDGFSIYSFASSVLTFIAGNTLESNITSLSWARKEDGSPYYHLVTSNANAPFVFVFTLDSTTLAPYEEFISYDGPALSANAAVSWHPSHQNIIGVGYEDGGSAQVGSLEFTGDELFLAGTPLTMTPGTNTNAIDWSSSGEQLAAVTNQGAIEIFSLDIAGLNQLTSQATALHDGQNIASVSFAPADDLIAIGGNDPDTDGSEVQLYRIAIAETAHNNHTITNNLVTKVMTNDFDGVGIRANSSANYVAANTCCNNNISYELVSPEYITSQANARGVYNIDCANGTLDEVKEILNQTAPLSGQISEIQSQVFEMQNQVSNLQDNVTTINNTVNLISEESWSIESKAEAISDKIDLVPSQYPISQGEVARTALSTQTISQPGSYFLNEDVTGDIIITSSEVTLDLNGFTLRGKITIGENFLKITIRNGKIAPVSGNGIEFNTGTGITLIENLTLTGDISFVSGSSTQNSVIKNCVFNYASINGVDASTIYDLKISDCYFATAESTPIKFSGIKLKNALNLSINNCLNLSLCNLDTCKMVTITNCSTSSFGFNFSDCEHVTTKNCKALGNNATGNGFYANAVDDIIFASCTAQYHDIGFDLVASVTGTLEKCIAERNNIGFLNEDSSNTGLIKECMAVNNATYGFDDMTTTSHITYAANIARGNGINYNPSLGEPFQPTPLSGMPTYWENVVP